LGLSLPASHAKYFLHEKGRIKIMNVLTQNSGIINFSLPSPNEFKS
jgi:hypothetical protein